MVLAGNSERESYLARRIHAPRGGDVLNAHDVGGLEAFWSFGEVKLDGLALI